MLNINKASRTICNESCQKSQQLQFAEIRKMVSVDPAWNILTCASQNMDEEMSGVPNDHFLLNCSYNVVTTNRTFLRQSSLIFNSAGKKIAALHCQQARVSVNKTPSQPSCKAGVNQPA